MKKFQFLIPLVLGAIYPLAFAPINWSALTLISVAALLIINNDDNPKAAFRRGWLWGFAAFGVGLSWIHVAVHQFGGAPLWLSALMVVGGASIMGLFPAITLYVHKKYFRTPLTSALAFAPLWFVSEYARAYVLTGFPWLYLGYSQTDTVLALLAPVGGVYLISFVIALMAATLALFFYWQKTRVAYVLATLFIVLTSWPYQLQREQNDDGAPISAALLQPNISQQLRWQPEQLQAIQQQYYTMSKSVINEVDLVVWPEGAIPTLAEYLDEYFDALMQHNNKTDAAVVVGIFTRDERGIYNAAAGLGAANGQYAKQHLVPFGEYVPFENWLRGLLEFFNLPMSGLQAGDPAKSVQFRGKPVLTAICYETTYPELVRDSFIAQGAQASWLLTISNDAWYGDSWGPQQHLQIVRMRAMELGLPVLRATATGLTVAIDHNGRVTAALPSYETGILRTQIQPQKTTTLWIKWGMWTTVLLCILLTSIAVAIERLKWRSKSPQS